MKEEQIVGAVWLPSLRPDLLAAIGRAVELRAATSAAWSVVGLAVDGGDKLRPVLLAERISALAEERRQTDDRREMRGQIVRSNGAVRASTCASRVPSWC